MQLTLSAHEAELFREILNDYLVSLRREVARTERHELRHLLVERQELAERLLAQLASS
jgi:hypothetical protein